jgi:general secretion pathway protein K
MARAPLRLALTRKRTSGAAVIAAMLLAVLASAIAAALLWHQQWGLKHHEHRREQVQAQALVLAGLQWARQILQEDARASTIDHLGEAWAFRLPPTPVENGEISGFIVDQQALFNVNNVVQNGRVEPRQVQILGRVLAGAGIDAAAAAALVDWIDADAVASGESGAEDTHYAAAGTAPANRPVLRLAEIGAVRGLSATAADALRNRLTALPELTSVNVNTAPTDVLRAAMPDLAPRDLETIGRERSTRAFASLADFRNRGVRGAAAVPEELLSVSSSFFLVTVEARQGPTLARGRALLRRAGTGLPTVVWQVIE